MPDRDVIDQLADTWGALAALGRDLDEAGWAAPTECPGWSVHDHVAHILGTESMLLGRPSPPPAAPAVHVRNPLGQMNEAWVEAWRPRPPGEVLDELEAVTVARLAALREMSDEELTKLGPSPIGEVPYATFMLIRVMDCWVHEQDVRQAVARPWRFAGPAAPAAVDRILGSLGFVVGKRVAPPEGAVVAVHLDAPLERDVALAVRDGRAVPGSDEAPTVSVAFPPDVFVRLAAGRLAGADALAAGAVAMEGDRTIGEALVTNLATIP